MGRSNKRSKKMGGAYNVNSDLGDGSTTVESNSNPPVTAVPGPESITPPVDVAAGQGAAPETTSWFSMSSLPSLSSLNPFAKKTEDYTAEITAAEAELAALKEKEAKALAATQVTTGGRRRSKKRSNKKRSNKKRSNKRRSSKKRTHKRRHR